MVGRRLVVEQYEIKMWLGNLYGEESTSGLIYEGKDPNCDQFQGNVKWRQVTSAPS